MHHGSTGVERGAAFRAGELIGGALRVEALLGEGGSGAVYRVKDERKGLRLALKQLQPPQDERRALVTSQFEREYHTLSQLAHPRIIEVHDYGFERGSAYYTMELLDGEDLHERGKLPWREACALLCDVASSLAIVHSRGLVHRDVSARNVRCTGDGRAKLIDFGAMAPMGGSHHLVGTPPFVPPEALQLQSLDGRADLYGLGALAYWTLTGRYAYPAHTFNQLRDLWRNPLPSPRLLDPSLPDALCELVLSLLRLDRAERPRAAAEVMERLSGIAGLPLQELPQVGRAYLIMPKLIGRDALVSEARAALLQGGHKSAGASVLIEGAPGSGRSRMLEACILEAKLMGATLLRASAGDAQSGDYAVARTLGTQLLTALPDLAHQNALPRIGLLASILPQLEPGAALPAAALERRHLQAALRDWLLAITRTRHVVIAVDDLDAIDEPSAAWLTALAHGARRRQLSLLLTARSDATQSSAVSLLRDLSRNLPLPALPAEQTHELLRSLFGDAPHLVQLADRIQQRSQGNPRRIMAMAEHLVARGAARYEAGSWTLPDELSPEDLPQLDREALARRVAELPAPARRLAEALSLTDPAALSLPDYAALADAADAGRTFQSLDALVAAGVLIPNGDRYRLSETDLLSEIAAALPEARTRELHARLARVLEATARPALLYLHMLRGGRERKAIERLLAAPAGAMEPGLLEALQCAVQVAQRAELPVRVQLHLQHRLVLLSAISGRVALFDEYARPLIERLERDSGMLDWFELEGMPNAPERLEQALKCARARYQDQPEALQGLPPDESQMLVIGLYRGCNVLASIKRDVQVLEPLHSLEPFRSLSPAIGLVQEAIDVTRALQTGRYSEMIRLGEALLRTLRESGASEPAVLGNLRLGTSFILAIAAASRGDASFAQWVTELENEPGHRGNAWRVHMLYAFALGNLERARDCQRRAELLDLQDSGALAFPGTTLNNELMGTALNRDVLGVKRVVDRLERLAAAYPGWRHSLAVARSTYKRLQGDPQTALELLSPSLEMVAPTRQIDWASVVSTQLLLLLELRRAGEAKELGLRYLDRCAQLDFEDGADGFKPILAAALTSTGDAERARDLLDESIARRKSMNYGGMLMAGMYEARARNAIGLGDEADTIRYMGLMLEACEQSGNHPTLQARYEQLRAAAAAVVKSLPQPAAPLPAEQADAMADAARTVYSRMLTCISPSERASRGLQLMLEATGAHAGYLFGLRSGGLCCLSSTDGSEPAAMLARTLDDYLRRQLQRELGSAQAKDRGAAIECFIDEAGREFTPLLLAGKHRGEEMIAGVAALHFGDDDRPPLQTPMLDAVIEALIAQDVVDPITCVA